MDAIVVFHLKPDFEVPDCLALFPRWSTCLRTLIFVNPEDVPSDSELNSEIDKKLNDQTVKVYHDSEMYQFLLEVICGLHSPLVGETEVMGQFREFLRKESKKENSWTLRWSSFFQNLLAVAKSIRDSHLKDLGSQSYGSLTRKLVKNQSDVSLWGAGQLAQEIRPWLSEKKLRVFARKKTDSNSYPLTAEGLKQNKIHQDILVIAAPLANDEIIDLILKSGVKYSMVLDWRGETNLNLDLKDLSSNIEIYVDFSKLMQSLEEEKTALQLKLVPVRFLIQEKVKQFSQRCQVRPQGWDDLCA